MKDKLKTGLPLLLLFLPIIDLFTSLFVRGEGAGLSIGVIVKGLMCVFGVLYIFFVTKSKYKKISMIFLSLDFVYCLVYLLLKYRITEFGFIKTEVTYLFKYFFIFVIFFTFVNIFTDIEYEKEKLIGILFCNYVIYILIYVLAFVTNTGFSSYADFNKGSNAWFYSANETSVILVLLLPSIYLYIRNFKKFYGILLYIPAVFAISLIGTKVSLLGMILNLVFIAVIYVKNHRKETEKLIIGFVTGVFCLIICLNSAGLLNTFTQVELKLPTESTGESDDATTDETTDPGDVSPSEDGFVCLCENGHSFFMDEFLCRTINYINSSKSFDLVFNSRQYFMRNTFDISAKGNIVDKAFGIGFCNRDSIDNKNIEKLVEIDFLDIYFRFGFIGFILYFAQLIYIIVIIVKKGINELRVISLFQIVLGLGISSVAGHVLGAPAVSVYLIYYMILALFDDKEISIKKNKVTIVHLHLNYGGIEKYVSSLCKMLGNKYDIELLINYKITDKPVFDFDEKINIKYILNFGPNKDEFKDALKNRQIFKVFKEGIRSLYILLCKRYKGIDEIRKIDSEFIITTGRYYNNLVGKYANNKSIKIATEHNFHNNDKKYIDRFLKSIEYTDKAVLVSDTLREFYDKYAEGKCVYIPNVIDNIPNKKSSLSDKAIINVGRLSPEKGQKDLIDVVALVKKQIPDIKCYIIGDGAIRDALKEYTESIGLESNIEFTGFLPLQEIGGYYLKSGVYAMTSFTESFGLTLIEAMSYGLPCVAFDCADGAKNLISNEEFLIKARDKQTMSDTIVSILSDNRKANEMAAESLRTANLYFIDNVKVQWLDFMESLSNK